MARRRGAWALLAAVPAVLLGCAHKPPTIPAVSNVDLPRFMGDWYVIAHVPTRFERRATNAVESYALLPDGRVQTTYQYRNDDPGQPLKTMRPVGFVRETGNNAVWDMQFVWPIRAEYVISHLAPDYSQTIIGRSDRDYAWVMARTPVISDADYAVLQDKLVALGYSISDLRRVPQQWPEQGEDARRR